MEAVNSDQCRAKRYHLLLGFSSGLAFSLFLWSYKWHGTTQSISDKVKICFTVSQLLKWNVTFQDFKLRFYRWKYSRRTHCLDFGTLEQEAIDDQMDEISDQSKPSPPPSYLDVTNPPAYSVAIHIWNFFEFYSADKTFDSNILCLDQSKEEVLLKIQVL